MQSRLGGDAWLALGSQLLMNTASFMVMPLFAVYMERQLDFGAAQIGTVLTVQLLATRLLPVVTGPLADRVGYRPMMVVGSLVRALGFAGFLVFSNFLPLLLSTLLIGLGGGLYGPAVMGVFATQPLGVRGRVFALHNLVLNLGVVVGPALGGLLAFTGPKLPFLGSAVAFSLLGLTLVIAGDVFPRPLERPTVLENYRRVLAHRPFCTFLLVMTLWWVLYSQLFVAFPVRAVQLGGGAQWAGVLFIANGVTGLATIFLVMRLLGRVSPLRLSTWGFLIAAAGFGLVPLVGSVWWLVLCVAIYTVAETVMLPSGEVQVAAYAGEHSGASFFGVYEGSWALGGSIGNYLGSWLILSGSVVIPWLVYAALALLGAAAMTLQQRYAKEPEVTPQRGIRA